MAKNMQGNRRRLPRQLVKALAVAMTTIMVMLPAAGEGETVYFGGRKYADATVATNSEFLSIVHDGGIKRIPWDKVPRSLKLKYPQPAAKPKPKPADEPEPAKKTTGQQSSKAIRERSSLRSQSTQRGRTDKAVSEGGQQNKEAVGG